LDYSRKEEGGDNKPDCQGHESIHKTSLIPTNRARGLEHTPSFRAEWPHEV